MPALLPVDTTLTQHSTNTERFKMISKKSYQPLVWCVRLLSTLRCLPAYWDADKEHIAGFADDRKGRSDLMMSKIVIALITLLHCGFILHLVSLIFLKVDISPQEIIASLFFIFLFSETLVVHIGSSLKFEGLFKTHMNSLMKLNQDYGQNILYFNL